MIERPAAVFQASRLRHARRFSLPSAAAVLSVVLALSSPAASLGLGQQGSRPDPRFQTAEVSMSPSDHTISVVKAYECWAVAAIQCADVAVFERGTRSQRMRFTVIVLTTARAPELPSPWENEQYAADRALLRKGVAFVVTLVCTAEPDGSTSWKIVQADELGDADPADAVAWVEGAVRQALGQP